MNKYKLLFSLIRVTFLVLVTIASFLYAQSVILPGLTVVYTHIVGIAFGILVIGATAYRVQIKQEQLVAERIDETERRMKSEASLRNTEENYHELFFESMDGVCKTTLDGKIIEANHAFCDIFGCNADKIIGESILQFYDNPEDRLAFRSAVEKNRGVKNYELVQKKVDGTRVVCSISSSFFSSEKGEPEGYLTILRDTTDLKRNEQETAVIAEIGRLIGSTTDIDEVYERFAAETRRLIPFDRITVSLCNIRENLVTIAYEDGADLSNYKKGESFPLTGTLTEELLLRRTGMIVQSEKMDEIVGRIPSFSRHFRAGLRSLLGVPLVYKDKAIGVMYFWSKTPDAFTVQDLRLAERIGTQIAGAVINTQLFADLRRTEISLRESESRFRALIEQAEVGVAEIEMSTGRFHMANRRLCEMVGRTQEELTSCTFQAITHPEDLHLHEATAALLLAGDIGYYTLEKRYVRKDGQSVWVNLTVSPLWKPGEKPRNTMIVVEDITDRKHAEESLKESEKRYRELSIIDDLTYLYNSRHFYFQLKNEMDRSNRYGQPLTLLLLDLDNFKHFNDTYGHVEGNQVLRRLGQVIKRCLRETDFAYRYGGEEFTVLLPMTTSADGFVTAERIRTEFKKEIFFPLPDKSVHVTVSVGLAQYEPPEEMKLFVHRADQLMYQGKKNGKDRVCCEQSAQELFREQPSLPF